MDSSPSDADEELDLRGMGCAGVLMALASLARASVKPWTVDVLTDDLGAPTELPAWCRLTGNMYVGLSTGEGPSARYTLILQAKDNS